MEISPINGFSPVSEFENLKVLVVSSEWKQALTGHCPRCTHLQAPLLLPLYCPKAFENYKALPEVARDNIVACKAHPVLVFCLCALNDPKMDVSNQEYMRHVSWILEATPLLEWCTT